MNTATRLVDYNPNFSTNVVETVAEVADWQQSLDDYQSFFQLMGITGLKRVIYRDALPADILDIRRDEEIPDSAIVYHLPMANPLDANQIYQAATIAKANPNHRLIAIARPSGLGYSGGRLKKSEREIVAKGDFGPTVEPLLRYLDQERVLNPSHVGYSYGVSTAMAAAEHGD